MITEDQAYIAVRKDGFVDGGCFTQSADAEVWVQEMKDAGYDVEVVDRTYARNVLFTHIARGNTLLA